MHEHSWIEYSAIGVLVLLAIGNEFLGDGWLSRLFMRRRK